jgi:hypothetical protein
MSRRVTARFAKKAPAQWPGLLFVGCRDWVNVERADGVEQFFVAAEKRPD